MSNQLDRLITAAVTVLMLLATSGVRNIWEAPETRMLLADFLRQESIQPRSKEAGSKDCDKHPNVEPNNIPKQAEI